MQAHELEDGVVATCHACQSSWLDNAASQSVVAGRLSRAFGGTRNMTPHVADDGYRVAAPRTGPERRCAVCDDPLRPVWVETERVTLDVCLQHGTYFDPHELDTIHRAAVHRNALAEEEARAFAKKLAQTRAEYFAQLGGRPPVQQVSGATQVSGAGATFLDKLVRVIFTRW